MKFTEQYEQGLTITEKSSFISNRYQQAKNTGGFCKKRNGCGMPNPIFGTPRERTLALFNKFMS